MTFKVGDTKSKPYVFDEQGIRAFAHGAGDMNVLHHDPEEAAKSRFKGLIASGAHMSAVLMGFGATMMTENHESLGLEFTFRFERAIRAGTETVLTWVITAVEPNARLGGDIISCEGSITGLDGTRYVSSKGKAVIWEDGKGPSHA